MTDCRSPPPIFIDRGLGYKTPYRVPDRRLVSMLAPTRSSRVSVQQLNTPRRHIRHKQPAAQATLLATLFVPRPGPQSNRTSSGLRQEGACYMEGPLSSKLRSSESQAPVGKAHRCRAAPVRRLRDCSATAAGEVRAGMLTRLHPANGMGPPTDPTGFRARSRDIQSLSELRRVHH